MLSGTWEIVTGVLDEVEFKEVDFLMTVLPYADLEKYSDDQDLSNIVYAESFKGFTSNNSKYFGSIETGSLCLFCGG
jgi:hypothetical protein